MRTLLEYTIIMLPGTAGAFDEELHVQVLLYHKFLEGQHSQHPLARDQGLAREARQLICDDVAHHRPYSWQCDTTRLIALSSHPFLAARETLSKMYPVSDRLPAPGPLPDGKHSYKWAFYIRRKSGQRTKNSPWFPPWPCVTSLRWLQLSTCPFHQAIVRISRPR